MKITICIIDSSRILESAKTKKINIDMKYMDQIPTLYIYLRQIPGSYGVLLRYIIIDNDIPYHTLVPDSIKGYIFGQEINGEAYKLDNKNVEAILVSLVVNNTKQETKIQSLQDINNGR